jgi:predicted nucleic acid-binding protein
MRTQLYCRVTSIFEIGDPLVPISAVRMHKQFQLSYRDGMILAASERTGVGILYSEDFSHNRA